MGTRKKHPLALGMLIYAMVFILLTEVGLHFLWQFLEAYEASRPKHVADAYLSQLTPERVLDGDPELAEAMDPNIQGREEALDFISDFLRQDLTVRRQGGQENTALYSVRLGKETVGTFTLSGENTGKFQFPQWKLEEEHFSLSRYIVPGGEITVPGTYHVAVNGRELSSDYILETDIRYPELEPYYEDFTLPTKTRYRTPDTLGEAVVTILDENGAEVTPDEEGQWLSVLENCTEEQQKRLEETLDGFLQRYISYVGSRAGSASANFHRLRPYLVPGSTLEKRLNGALFGLSHGQSMGNKLSQWQRNRYFQVDDTHYFCDLTYEMIVTGKKGDVAVQDNLKLILVDTDGKLLVEVLENY